MSEAIKIVVSETINGSLRPGDQILFEVVTKWVFARHINCPEGAYVGLEAKSARAVRLSNGDTLIATPGVCIATTRDELDTIIGALIAMRERLPEGS